MTIHSAGEPQAWEAPLLDDLSEVLARRGGTAGVRCVDAPPPLDSWHGVDAVVVSTDNAWTGSEPPG